MTGIFKANNPSGNALLFVYAILLKLPLFIHGQMPQLQPLDGIFYKLLLNAIAPIGKGFSSFYGVITFLLLFIQAISFNSIVNGQRLLKQHNYLTGMSYLLITSIFSEWFTLSAPLIVNTILIWIWGRLCTLYNNPNPKTSIFNIGLATGIAAFFYFPSVCFLLLIIIGIGIARPFRLQEWLLGLLGIITPIYFFASYLFINNKWSTYKYPGFHFSLPHISNSKWYIVAGIILSLSVIMGLYFINANMRRQVVQTRKSWQLLFLYIFVAAIVPLLNAGVNFTYFILLAVPLAPVVAASFFYPQKKWLPFLLHWSFVGIYLAVQFFNK
ncbi:DUF6427 family protein [Ferruginibacter yonginensis]|uniref:DUF6427 family protein n=1 Tax=Ferruginibacter yonginensis TaxID=1310416 RepID=A0ABV8QUV1_9BACT